MQGEDDIWEISVAIVEIKRLQAAYAKVAVLFIHDQVYLPIFLRVEAEIAAAQSTGNAISRARAIAALHSAIV